MNDFATDTTVVDTGVAPTTVQFDADGNPVLPAILDLHKGDVIEATHVQTVDEVGNDTVQ